MLSITQLSIDVYALYYIDERGARWLLGIYGSDAHGEQWLSHMLKGVESEV